MSKQKTIVDLELVKKYDRPGPRYTSYPTAPQFAESFTPQDFREEIIATNASASGDISLYCHLPFCKKQCFFCACHMFVTQQDEMIEKYNQYLMKEIEQWSAYISPKRKVSQLHWGGGTPSYLLPSQIITLASCLFRNFTFAEDAEVSIEIDPRVLTYEKMKALKDSGFNRVSLGVQDFNPQVQEAINRVQDAQITYQAMEWSREMGFGSINVDLIYGLPFQTVASFEETLDEIIKVAPERIALFSYAHVPWMKKHQTLIKEETLPSPEEKLKILKMATEKLTDEGGYVYIGMDHFAKPEDELTKAQQEKTLRRNFQGYSTRAGLDLYAFGISGISQTEHTYAQNVKDFKSYYAAIESNSFPVYRGYRLTSDDYIRREVIMQIMCDLGVEKKTIEKQFAISFDEYFHEALSQLDPFEGDGLISNDKEVLRVTEKGRLFVRNIAMLFDAYLKKPAQQDKPMYSRTV